MLLEDRSFELNLWLDAALLIAAVLLLGIAVADRTPHGIDVEAIVLRGRSQPAAQFFTLLGRWPVLVGVGALAALGAIVLHANAFAIGVLLLAQGVTQAVNTAIKLLFHRARPDYWIKIQERDHSYPSGHSATSIFFYAGLALLVVQTATIPRPLAALIVALLAICVIGIPWSRLSLGAHYVTDVFGGILFGCACLCIAAALLSRYGFLSASRIHG